ncbi:MAG: prepilin-type N-terminal cleavage/methylation domain-containing protein [Tepidisphaeraceae bacterium]|jgi:prepilin-type N-terminal cleavage/methylation domain-containing protein
MRTRRHKNSGGFTLIEVLITLLYIAIVLPALMGSIVTAAKIADGAKRRDEASGLAQAQLNQILADGTWQNGSSSGDFGVNFPDYKWTSNVQAWAADASGMGIDQIDVTVSWRGPSGQDQSLMLSTLAYPRSTQTTTQ